MIRSKWNHVKMKSCDHISNLSEDSEKLSTFGNRVSAILIGLSFCHSKIEMVFQPT